MTEQDDKKNVIDISSIIKAQSAPNEIKTMVRFIEASRNKSNRLKRTHVAAIYADAMLGGPIGHQYLPGLKFQPFVILADALGQKQICEVKDQDVLIRKDKQWLRSTVAWAGAKACQSFDTASMVADFHLAAKDVDSVVSTILDTCSYIKDSAVEPFRWLSEPGYCWSRCAFDPTPYDENSTPAYLKLFDGTLAHDDMLITLESFLGAVFTKGVMPERFLWVYGPANAGKGSVLNVARHIMGSAFSTPSFNTAQMSSQHWTASLVGKRLAVGTDVNNTTIVHDDNFKAMTGGDSVNIRPLYKDAYTERLPVLFAITSNKRPKFKGEDYVQRRIAYVEFKERESNSHAPDESIKKAVLDEAPYIVSRWLDAYRKYPSIPNAEHALGALAEEVSADDLDVFDKEYNGRPRFIFGPDKRMKPARLWEILDEKNAFKQSDLLQVLKKQRGVSRVQLLDPKTKFKTRYLVGIGENADFGYTPA